MSSLKNIFLAPVIASLILLLSFSSYGQTQSQLNMQASLRYKTVDKELNVVYQKILKEYANQPKFIQNLKRAQRLWVQLRDAELAARYPDSGTYGSVESMCKSAFLEELTNDRITYLKVRLDKLPEVMFATVLLVTNNVMNIT